MKKPLLSIFLRYFAILFAGLNSLYFFYVLFTPITLSFLEPTLKLLFEASLKGTTFYIQGFNIEIIKACIAGSAYYLLFALNLALPNIELKKRTKIVLFSFGAFLLANVLRITFLFYLISTYSFSVFDITHKISWYSINILLVVGIWFLNVYLFKIKSIPFYSDFSYLLSLKKRKKSKSSKKNN